MHTAVNRRLVRFNIPSPAEEAGGQARRKTINKEHCGRRYSGMMARRTTSNRIEVDRTCCCLQDDEYSNIKKSNTSLYFSKHSHFPKTHTHNNQTQNTKRNKRDTDHVFFYFFRKDNTCDVEMVEANLFIELESR